MTASQIALFDDEVVASVRLTDPLTARRAAAHDRDGRRLQKRRMLAHMAAHGPCTADDLAVVIERHRSVASTRLNVLRKEGHAEKCGVTPRADEYGRVRDVELWRATPAGLEAIR